MSTITGIVMADLGDTAWIGTREDMIEYFESDLRIEKPYSECENDFDFFIQHGDYLFDNKEYVDTKWIGYDYSSGHAEGYFWRAGNSEDEALDILRKTLMGIETDEPEFWVCLVHGEEVSPEEFCDFLGIDVEDISTFE